MTGYTATLAKASMHFGPGMLEGGLTCSPEMLVLDSDIISMMRYADNGILVNDEELALEDIHQVGPGRDYFALPMTMERMNSQSSPMIFDRQDVGAWMEEFKGKEAARVAHDKVKEYMDGHEPVPIDRDILAELEKVMAKADEEAKHSTSVY